MTKQLTEEVIVVFSPEWRKAAILLVCQDLLECLSDGTGGHYLQLSVRVLDWYIVDGRHFSIVGKKFIYAFVLVAMSCAPPPLVPLSIAARLRLQSW